MNFSVLVSAQFAQQDKATLTLHNFSAAGWCAGKIFNRRLKTAHSLHGNSPQTN